MTEIAQANANDTCKQITLALPLDPPLILEMMVEACAKRAVIPEPQKRGEGSKRMVSAATPYKQHNAPLVVFFASKRDTLPGPIWPVHKSDGEWRLTVDYRALNEVTPPLSAAVPDMLELQYKLESKAAKCVQLALDIAEREKWLKLYLYTDLWMVDNALRGWLERWKKANWQRRGKPIWAADEWKDIATRLEKLPVKVCHVDAHVPKSWANEEHQNKEQVIHDCETCAAIKQAKRVKPLWYGRQWSKYKYGEAWQIDYITLPQTHQGKRYVLTMVEATTGWLETYPVPMLLESRAFLWLPGGSGT
ncbi:hypothetical protein DUI87_02482 [Hirundo rustica rustica]|uniref:RNase H type-1 domain-containing protein n=1 Tax=Hirundo rustica rustica TaxID=333673 RepID=A0A3M0L8B6_HIRRU|nr:hypothetical protein DUI87_02482 [Hirundo rustica rustica]